MEPSGNVSSFTRVDAPSTLTFLVSGKVIFVGPREGDSVKRGQKLAEIDPLDYRLSVAAAAATLEQAKVGLRRAEEEYGRMKFLYDSKSLTANDYEKFKATLDGAGEQVRQATANDELARKRLSDATLVAPIDGYIDMRGIEPGETASPGRAVFRMVRLDPLTAALAATRGNQIRAADLLGVNRNTLRKKIRDLDIQVFRGSN